MTSHKKVRKDISLIESLFNSMPFSYVFWKNTEGIYQGGSTKQLMMFDAKGTGFIGKTIFDILEDKQAAQAINDVDNKIMQEGIPLTLEEEIITATGEKKVFLSQKEPIKDTNGKIIGLVGFAIDISKRKALEEELLNAKKASEAANQAKTEFMENMRHDIRTPLTGIVGFADLLKMEADSPHLKEYAENLVASSHALLDLLDEVLEAIHVSSGEIPKLKKKFNLQKTVEHVIELNRAKAAQKQLSLSFILDPSLPKYVIGDKVRFHRIALELVSNALNFTDTGFVKIDITLARVEKEKLVLKMCVQDSGIGIPKDKQQEIYVQFKRLTPSYKGIYKGAGLGLSVVKQFIDELNGEMYVESEVNCGTTFTCFIPLQQPLINDAFGADEELDSLSDASSETTYIHKIHSKKQEGLDHPFRVLVVEDNAIAQTVATSLLNQLGCGSDIALTGEEAIMLWKTGEYDLIFMDIGLPDLDGYEVAHNIRIQELPQKTHVPIIALTAHAGEENKQRCIEAGMNAVITKPLTPKSCMDILEAFIPGFRQDTLKQTLTSPELPKIDELFELNNFPILNIEEGIQTTGTEDTLADMLTFMITDSLPQDFTTLKKYHDANDWDKTQQFAHKIKGGAVYVGTTKLKMACQYFERYWKSGQRELLEPLYQQTVSVIEESIQVIEKWLKNR